MDGPPVPPAVRDDARHSMEESGEPSPWFFGTHSTNHNIRWKQAIPIPPAPCAQQRPAARGPRRARRLHWRTQRWRGVKKCVCNSYPVNAAPVTSPMPFMSTLSGLASTVPGETVVRQRRKLWEFPSHLHCSIVGTCLRTTELRKIVAKCQEFSLKDLSDLTVHEVAVRTARYHNTSGRLLHKAFDRRHEASIKRFNKAQDTHKVSGICQAVKRQPFFRVRQRPPCRGLRLYTLWLPLCSGVCRWYLRVGALTRRYVSIYCGAHLICCTQGSRPRYRRYPLALSTRLTYCAAIRRRGLLGPAVPLPGPVDGGNQRIARHTLNQRLFSPQEECL